MVAADMMTPFQWGSGGKKLTPEQVERQREIAAALMQSGTDTSPVGHWTQGLARVAQALVGRIMENRAERAEAEGRSGAASALSDLSGSYYFPPAPGGGRNPGTSSSMAAMPAPDYASARVAQAHGDSGGGFNGDLRSGIIATAEAIGADPLDLATAISYETAGTFDPTKRGPRTQWGQHRGLIQFGEPQARQHGVDWNDPLRSQLGPDGAIANYFRSSGFKPGMSGLDLYSTINAGAPGRYTASDANNGGAPGSVRDKWENQMAGHRQKAAALLGSAGLPATSTAPEMSNGLTPDALQQWAANAYPPSQTNSAVGAVNALGAAQPVGVAETEADILTQEAAMAGQDPMAFAAAPPLSPPREIANSPVLAALTNASVNPDVPMAGGATGFAPVGTQAPSVSLPAGAGFSLPDPSGAVAQALAASGQQASLATSPVAQALIGNSGAETFRGTPYDSDMPGHAPLQPGQAGPSLQQLVQAANNPWLNQQERSILNAMLEQRLQAQDPKRQLEIEKAQLEIDAMRNGTPGLNSSFGNLDAQARAAGLVPGTPEYQNFMLNGGGAPATFRALDMQAQAAGFSPGTPEYNEFMATRGAGLQAGAAQTAKNVADIETGGAAAGAKEGGKKTMEAGFSAWEDYGKLQTSIGNMDEAIAAIDAGGKSGVIYKMLPNITEASASLQNAMDRMGLDVIGAVTFGALSEGEMRLAMQTAAPRDLSSPELRNWMVRKRDAQIKAADMLADAAQYLTKPGNTINGWIERNRAAKQGSGDSGQVDIGERAGSSRRYRYNAETGELE